VSGVKIDRAETPQSQMLNTETCWFPDTCSASGETFEPLNREPMMLLS